MLSSASPINQMSCLLCMLYPETLDSPYVTYSSWWTSASSLSSSTEQGLLTVKLKEVQTANTTCGLELAAIRKELKVWHMLCAVLVATAVCIFMLTLVRVQRLSSSKRSKGTSTEPALLPPSPSEKDTGKDTARIAEPPVSQSPGLSFDVSVTRLDDGDDETPADARTAQYASLVRELEVRALHAEAEADARGREVSVLTKQLHDCILQLKTATQQDCLARRGPCDWAAALSPASFMPPRQANSLGQIFHRAASVGHSGPVSFFAGKRMETGGYLSGGGSKPCRPVSPIPAEMVIEDAVREPTVSNPPEVTSTSSGLDDPPCPSICSDQVLETALGSKAPQGAKNMHRSRATSLLRERNMNVYTI